MTDPVSVSLAAATDRSMKVVREALSGYTLALGIAVAGALGALSRWGLGQWLEQFGGGHFPYGTLAANLVGCFLLGVVMQIGAHSRWMSGELRTVIAVGFIGALTTFSTWEFETFHMARGGQVLLAAGNFAVNVFFGFVLIWAGGRLAAGLLH
ncbi:MAG: fluoride efflux transporter FluC [Terriglobales bacterium]